MEVKGKIIKNLGVQSGTSKSGKNWSKATIILEYGDAQYPKQVALDNLKRAEEFAKLPVGAEGTFSIEVSSHEYNGRWFTSATCWKWDLPGQAAPVQSATPTLDAMGVSGHPQPQPQAAPSADDGLPF